MKTIFLTFAMVAASGQYNGGAYTLARTPQSGEFYHHSGNHRMGPAKPGKTRRNKQIGISQVTKRKNRRRAHAAGRKNAFA